MTIAAEQALDNMRLNRQEKAATAGMPSDVALGYMRAKRKAEGGKMYGNATETIADLFSNFNLPNRDN
jgi:hypothetical protein